MDLQRTLPPKGRTTNYGSQFCPNYCNTSQASRCS